MGLEFGRIAKSFSTHGDLVAAAYWGGTLQLLLKDGQAHRLQLLPQDITGLAWLGGRLEVGLAYGRLAWPDSQLTVAHQTVRSGLGTR